MKYILFILSLFLLSTSAFADTNGIWINAGDVRGGIFGSDESNSDFSFIGLVSFNDVVNFNQRVNLNNDTIYKGTLLEDVFVLEGQTNSISTSMIQNGAVTTPKISNLAVTNDKIADNTIRIGKVNIADFDGRYYQKNEVYNKIESDNKYALLSNTYTQSQSDSRYVLEGQTNSISSGMIQNGAVTTPKISNLAVTNAKIADGTIRIGKVNIADFDGRYYTKSQVNSLVSSSSGNSCSARSFTIPANDHRSWTCTVNVPNSNHLEISSGTRSSLYNGDILVQCVNGNWRIISQSCWTGGGR